jgi:hypothetical protein
MPKVVKILWRFRSHLFTAVSYSRKLFITLFAGLAERLLKSVSAGLI